MRVAIVTDVPEGAQVGWGTAESVGQQFHPGIHWVILGKGRLGFDLTDFQAAHPGVQLSIVEECNLPELVGDAEYLCWLDPGDQLTLPAIAMMVKLLDCQPTHVAAVGHMQLIAGNEQRMIAQMEPAFEQAQRVLQIGSWLETSGTLIRRSLLEKLEWPRPLERRHFATIAGWGDFARYPHPTLVRIQPQGA